MTTMVCIVHKWVMFMESSGRVIPRCKNCGIKRG